MLDLYSHILQMGRQDSLLKSVLVMFFLNGEIVEWMCKGKMDKLGDEWMDKGN